MPVKLLGNEAKCYNKLAELIGVEQPLQFLFYALSAKPHGDNTWLVESKTSDAIYIVDTELNACTCPALSADKCPHKRPVAWRESLAIKEPE
jgi:hypothetical protein